MIGTASPVVTQRRRAVAPLSSRSAEVEGLRAATGILVGVLAGSALWVGLILVLFNIR